MLPEVWPKHLLIDQKLISGPLVKSVFFAFEDEEEHIGAGYVLLHDSGQVLDKLCISSLGISESLSI